MACLSLRATHMKCAMQLWKVYMLWVKFLLYIIVVQLIYTVHVMRRRRGMQIGVCSSRSQWIHLVNISGFVSRTRPSDDKPTDEEESEQITEKSFAVESERQAPLHDATELLNSGNGLIVSRGTEVMAVEPSETHHNETIDPSRLTNTRRPTRSSGRMSNHNSDEEDHSDADMENRRTVLKSEDNSQSASSSLRNIVQESRLSLSIRYVFVWVLIFFGLTATFAYFFLSFSLSVTHSSFLCIACVCLLNHLGRRVQLKNRQIQSQFPVSAKMNIRRRGRKEKWRRPSMLLVYVYLCIWFSWRLNIVNNIRFCIIFDRWARFVAWWFRYGWYWTRGMYLYMRTVSGEPRRTIYNTNSMADVRHLCVLKTWGNDYNVY